MIQKVTIGHVYAVLLSASITVPSTALAQFHRRQHLYAAAASVQQHPNQDNPLEIPKCVA